MTYADLETRKGQLIRKALEGSAFIAPMSAEPIAALTTAGGATAPLPAGYRDPGWMTEEGMAFSGDTSQSDVTSFGSTTPTRSDIISETTTLTLSLQETNSLTIELLTGADPAAITVDASTGELFLAKPLRPSARHYRVLALAVDRSDTGAEIYIARFLPRAKVTAKTAPNYAGGDAPLVTGVTVTGFLDDALGYTEAYIFGGPGWIEILDDMGITGYTAP